MSACHFATPWTAARQASMSFTISWSLFKLISVESVMPSSHLILCCLLLPSIFPSISVHHVLYLIDQSCRLFVTWWIVACQAPLSKEILQSIILEWVAMPSSTEGISYPCSKSTHLRQNMQKSRNCTNKWLEEMSKS